MANYNDLLNVTFEDATNYSSASNTQDVLGVILPWFWSPAEERAVYTRAEFFQTFPESLPFGTTVEYWENCLPGFFTQYAHIKSYFNNGGKLVEVISPRLGADRERTQIAGALKNEDNTLWQYIYCRNQGFFPASLLPEGTIWVLIDIATTNGETYTYTMRACAHKDKALTSPIIEQFTGQITTPTATQDGVSTYLPTIINDKSMYFSMITKKDAQTLDIEKNFASVSADYMTGATSRWGIAFHLAGGVDECPTGYTNARYSGPTFIVASQYATDFADKYFGDPNLTQATMIIPQLQYTSLTNAVTDTKEETNKKSVKAPPTSVDFIANAFTVAESNKTMTLFSGIKSVTETGENTWVTPDMTTSKGKFHIHICGWEGIPMFNTIIPTNCAGGVAGAYARVADSAHLNQVASARTYGQYTGALLKTKTFADVLRNHENGVVTVYTGAQGAEIFGIHNTYYTLNKNSYWGTCNATRVIARILRDTFPIFLDAIHTDVASNSASRLSLCTRVQSKFDSLIATQDLAPDSKVWMTDEMNTDYLTRGGKELNALMQVHFYGLTERVNIKVVATDSSVNFEIA